MQCRRTEEENVLDMLSYLLLPQSENLHWQYGATGETLRFPQLFHAKESEISSECATKSAKLPLISLETE